MTSETLTTSSTEEAPIKPGYKTTEFWLTVLAAVLGLLGANHLLSDSGVVGQVIAFVTMTLSTLGYTMVRGLVKHGESDEPGPGYKTTEFWLTVVSLAVGLAATSGLMPTDGPVAQAFALAQSTLVALGYTIARGFAKTSP